MCGNPFKAAKKVVSSVAKIGNSVVKGAGSAVEKSIKLSAAPIKIAADAMMPEALKPPKAPAAPQAQAGQGGNTTVIQQAPAQAQPAPDVPDMLSEMADTPLTAEELELINGLKRRGGRNSLKIDLTAGLNTAGGTGLNIPRG